MKYVFNEERNRLEDRSWNPFLIKAVYRDTQTGEERALMLHTISSNPKQQTTVAEKYMETNEVLDHIEGISRSVYEKWLVGESELEVDGVKLPAKFITDFLIAEDFPQAKKNGIYGDLTKYKMCIKEGDSNLIQKMLESYEMIKPEHDFVRIAPDLENER